MSDDIVTIKTYQAPYAPQEIVNAFKRMAVTQSSAKRKDIEGAVHQYLQSPQNDANALARLNPQGRPPRNRLFGYMCGYHYAFPLFHLAVVIGSPTLIQTFLDREDLLPEYDVVSNSSTSRINYLGQLGRSCMARDLRDRRDPSSDGLHPETTEAFRMLVESAKIPFDLSRCGTPYHDIREALQAPAYKELLTSLAQQRFSILTAPMLPIICAAFLAAVEELRPDPKQIDSAEAVSRLKNELPTAFESALNKSAARGPAFGNIVLRPEALNPGTQNPMGWNFAVALMDHAIYAGGNTIVDSQNNPPQGADDDDFSPKDSLFMDRVRETARLARTKLELWEQRLTQG